MANVKIVQLQVGPMMNYAYLVGDPASSTCAAVDPSWDSKRIIDAANKEGWKIEAILMTHMHFDHANALEAISIETGARVYVHRDEISDVPAGVGAKPTEDGTIIDIGKMKVKCLHTPGHTPGSQCFLVDEFLLTGDTLFVDGCGRVDLPGSNPSDMLKSLKRLSALDHNIIVYPGHDYGSSCKSTIGDQIRQNPYLSADNENVLL